MGRSNQSRHDGIFKDSVEAYPLPAQVQWASTFEPIISADYFIYKKSNQTDQMDLTMRYCWQHTLRNGRRDIGNKVGPLVLG